MLDENSSARRILLFLLLSPQLTRGLGVNGVLKENLGCCFSSLYTGGFRVFAFLLKEFPRTLLFAYLKVIRDLQYGYRNKNHLGNLSEAIAICM